MPVMNDTFRAARNRIWSLASDENLYDETAMHRREDRRLMRLAAHGRKLRADLASKITWR